MPSRVSAEQLETRRLFTATLFASKVPFPSDGIEPGDTSIADVNNDHRPDIVFGNSHSQTVGVLINKGNNHFSGPRVTDTGLPNIAHVATGDLDGDGKIDVVVSSDITNLVILKGRGDGHFDYVKKVAAANVGSIVTADFNGDGKLDIAATETDHDDIFLILNRGGGSFSTPKHVATTIAPFALSAADLNGDGKLDLVATVFGVVGSDVTCGIDYFFGNGAGSFGAKQHYHFVGGPEGLAVADINRDKIPDLLIANSGTSSFTGVTDSMTVLIGKKSGTFKLFHSYATLGDPRGVATGDFNGDGFIDAAVACHNSAKTSVFLGKGDGTFQAGRGILAAPAATAISVGDLNKDGRVDLVFNGTDDNTIDVLFQV